VAMGPITQQWKSRTSSLHMQAFLYGLIYFSIANCERSRSDAKALKNGTSIAARAPSVVEQSLVMAQSGVIRDFWGAMTAARM
jgi:hypothetical protein